MRRQSGNGVEEGGSHCCSCCRPPPPPAYHLVPPHWLLCPKARPAWQFRVNTSNNTCAQEVSLTEWTLLKNQTSMCIKSLCKLSMFFNTKKMYFVFLCLFRKQFVRLQRTRKKNMQVRKIIPIPLERKHDSMLSRNQNILCVTKFKGRVKCIMLYLLPAQLLFDFLKMIHSLQNYCKHV